MEELERVLINRKEIAQRVKELASSISQDYQKETVLFVGVLKGAVVFLADLIRNMSIPVEIDFMAVSSYGNSTKSSGEVRILKDLEQSIDNKNVLIVEDIMDTGLTLQFLSKTLQQRHPLSIRVVTLLDKPQKRLVNIQPDYLGFTVGDNFVVGYGLDFGEKFRGLPDIHVLKTIKG